MAKKTRSRKISWIERYNVFEIICRVAARVALEILFHHRL
jgi:hypothetical protein